MRDNNLILKKIFAVIMVVVALLPIYFMSIDDYFSGDELITYSMANNDEAGFVFAEGKISRYFKNEVFHGSMTQVVGNLVDMAVDVLQNGRESRLLSYNRDPEVKVYSNAEMVDWFAKRQDERFDFYNTWIHSLSDDGNAWFYECLVNFSSSFFITLSATKWSAFLVNYIFYILTLLIIWKIGIQIGNTAIHNEIMLSCYGLWHATLAIVTNLRAYGVASFWAALLVLTALEIHDVVVNDKKVKTGTLVKFIIVYAIGFVAHYTIGAILTTYGLALVAFMLISRNKHVGKIILTGVISLFAGIALAPDSIVGLLFEYSNKGASPMPIMMYPYIISFVIILIALIIVIIKKKNIVKNSMFYMTFSTLLCFLMIIYGTNGIGYARIAYPLAFIVIASLLLRGTDKLLSDWKLPIITAVVIIFAVYNCISMYNQKQSENDEVEVKREVLENLGITDCIYFREHARGYKDTILLRDYFETVQLVTVDTEGWELLTEYDGMEDSVVCYFTDESESDDEWKWIKSLGYNNFEKIFSNEDTFIYIASK